MRVAVTGATGNVGTSLLRVLASDDRVEEVVGLARRVPDWQPGNVTWRQRDLLTDDLAPALDGVDAVVHLAWLVQPSRDVDRLWDVNVRGSRRLFSAATDAGVSAIVHASSIGAYSPGPRDGHAVDESWPTDGIGGSSYSRAKAYVERCLDALEHRQPAMRVVRMRPALIFQRQAADRVRRLFLGALLPPSILQPGRLPAVPVIPGLRFQAVHADDVAVAIRSAIFSQAEGAFNLAADPVLTLRDVAGILDSRPVPVPAALARSAVAVTWAGRLQPVDIGWFDLAAGAPLMTSARAHRELGWRPDHGAAESLAELLGGIRNRAGGPTDPLDATHPQPLEVTSRQGASEARP